MTITKFCINCKWCLEKQTYKGGKYACIHPESIRIAAKDEVNPVTGEAIDIFERASSCEVMRDFGIYCGKQGEWFESKE